MAAQHGVPASDTFAHARRTPARHSGQCAFINAILRRKSSCTYARRPLRRFGNPRGPSRQIFVPVPLFYPIYGDDGVSFRSRSLCGWKLRLILRRRNKLQPTEATTNCAPPTCKGAPTPWRARTKAATASTIWIPASTTGNARQQSKIGHGAEIQSGARRAAAQPAPSEDKSPRTVFIFKDGHQLETKNYAIMGGTLFDFSGKALKKIKSTSLIPQPPIKANDDRGSNGEAELDGN